MPLLGAIPGYHAYKVRVIDPDPRRFIFDLAGGIAPTTPVTGLEVDLTNTQHVWPGVPSTAVHAQKNQYGFLLLSKEYMEPRVTLYANYSEGPGKWPFGADKMQQARTDARNDILRSVSDLLRSVAALQEMDK
ncbi:hypothetical protein [Hyalangium gracile]|uniref:hypothetical protein n=1 Tax=Hyalangium gracile TaxID=394092 RepID=UPI001CCF51AD|nr:hypothetical protein [Hyalangium gracile]